MTLDDIPEQLRRLYESSPILHATACCVAKTEATREEFYVATILAFADALAATQKEYFDYTVGDTRLVRFETVCSRCQESTAYIFDPKTKR